VTPFAVLGATGYTGGLVCARAREVGLPLRLLGRRRAALDAMARPGEEVRVVDARDEQGLTSALEGAFAVGSCAGPFLEVGFAPVSAAVAAGVHYLDTTGEQAFAERVYDEFGPRAASRGVVLLTAFGFDYVPGDLAARLAAEELEPLDEVVVAYSIQNAVTSRGTRRTMGSLAGKPHAALVDGERVRSPFGATTARVRFPFGEREVVEWGGTEPLTVPRHTQVRTVRSYLRAPKPAARLAPLARLAAPIVRLSARFGPPGPSEAGRRGNRFAVVAEARGRAGGRRVTLTGSDPYGLTARLIVEGAVGLRDGVSKVGALAPAEAFDARSLVDKLAPLLEIESIDEL
jgi:short subunit dehydrogenase-like uncharacterized protein